jgi:hypothetical protein
MSTCYSAQISFQRYRLDVISRWPDSEYKQSVMRAVLAAITRETEFAGLSPLANAMRSES